MTFRAAMRCRRGAAGVGAHRKRARTAASPALRQAADVIAQSAREHRPRRPGIIAPRAIIRRAIGRRRPDAHSRPPRSASDAVAVDAGDHARRMDHPNEDTATQIVQAITLQWSRGVGEAHIRLEPQHFGGLTVSLKVEHGQVVARLQADTRGRSASGCRAIRRLLRQSLADQQLTLDRLEVTEPREPGRRRRHDAAPSRTAGRAERPARRTVESPRRDRRERRS